ncbi:MAG: metallophosphoesterase [Candidatus Omnitrophica bacterium]|nr:metallophosphoesterase [Candidatus Omnitrophota bacterium]
MTVKRNPSEGSISGARFGRIPAILALIGLFGLGAPSWTAEPMPATIDSDVASAAKPWTNLDLNNDPNLIRFAIVSDNAGGPRAGIFGEAVAKINLLQPEFVMSIGDFIEGYENTREQLDAQWDGFMRDVNNFEMPFFFVPGNHDNGKPLWAEIYRRRFGAEYYHFVYKNVLFLCLSTNDGPENNTGISQNQVDYVARVLERRKDVRWTLVFQHKPLWNDQGNEGWAKIAALLKGRKCTAFAGHTHNYLRQEKDGISFITLATTGGGSALRGPAYGEFDQIAWVTLTDEGPRVANLLMDGILDKDVRTEAEAKDYGLFRAGRAVTATSILADPPAFASGKSTLRIKNPTNAPLRMKVLSESQPGVRVEPGSVSAVVPGMGELVTELQVSAGEPIPIAQAQPVVLHWEAFLDRSDNTPSTRFAGEVRVTVDSPMEIPKRDSAPSIDGSLEDWSDLPFQVDQPGEVWHNPPGWRGPWDGSFRFGVAHDDEFIYVAVRATDDQPCFDGWKYWEDFALVWVDGRADGQGDPKTSIFTLMAGPRLSEEQKEEFSEGQAPETVRTASRATESGFEAEFAIPLSYLKDRQGGDWKEARLNVGFSDYDSGDAREGVTLLYWRPQWTSPTSAPQSGIFRRADKN